MPFLWSPLILWRAAVPNGREPNTKSTSQSTKGARKMRTPFLCFLCLLCSFPVLFGRFLQLHLLRERLALNDSKNQRRKLVVILSGFSHDRTNGRQVVVLHCATQSKS